MIDFKKELEADKAILAKNGYPSKISSLIVSKSIIKTLTAHAQSEYEYITKAFEACKGEKEELPEEVKIASSNTDTLSSIYSREVGMIDKALTKGLRVFMAQTITDLDLDVTHMDLSTTRTGSSLEITGSLSFSDNISKEASLSLLSTTLEGEIDLPNTKGLKQQFKLG